MHFLFCPTDLYHREQSGTRSTFVSIETFANSETEVTSCRQYFQRLQIPPAESLRNALVCCTPNKVKALSAARTALLRDRAFCSSQNHRATGMRRLFRLTSAERLRTTHRLRAFSGLLVGTRTGSFSCLFFIFRDRVRRRPGAQASAERGRLYGCARVPSMIAHLADRTLKKRITRPV
jgi:hypothetical protein